MCTQTKEDYNKFSISICQWLSAVYGILYLLCELSLRNRLEAKPEYEAMCKSKRYYAMKLLGLMKKVCNGSAHVVVDDVVGNLLESLFNAIWIRIYDFLSLPKYMEASDHRYSVLEEVGFNITNKRFRDTLITKLLIRR